MEAKEVIALDADIVRESARERDKNGYLNVKTSRLTRDQVAPYYGKEIPQWKELGLDPERIYYGWRHPDELQKALDTFNGKPLLIEHKFDSAANPNTNLRVGTVGTSAQWEAPYITNALSVWDEEAIEAIEDGSLKELSCGYRYRPDFTPGKTPDGIAYDFVMRDIACNHVALVHSGRAGDCYVEDALPEEMKMEENDKGGACDDFTEFARKVIEGANTGLSPEAIENLVRAFAEAHAAHEKAQAEATPPQEGTDEGEPATEPKTEAEDEGEKTDAPADKDAEDEDGAKDEGEEETKPAEGAQDAALIAKTVKAQLRALYSAAEAVKPVIGAVAPLAYDSAADIYLDALKQMKYAGKVKPSEAKAVFMALQSVKGKRPEGAEDSAPKPASKASFLDKYL